MSTRPPGPCDRQSVLAQGGAEDMSDPTHRISLTVSPMTQPGGATRTRPNNQSRRWKAAADRQAAAEATMTADVDPTAMATTHFAFSSRSASSSLAPA